MVTTYLALGSNLGDSAKNVHLARIAVDAIAQTAVVSSSSLYKSRPIDAAGEDFVNAVIKIETALNPYDLLTHLQQLECQAGRAPPQERVGLHHAPRTLDIDILLYGNASVCSRALTIPHPRMWQRAFVLLPLFEIAPQLISPGQLAAVGDQEIARLQAAA